VRKSSKGGGEKKVEGEIKILLRKKSSKREKGRER
jgi:hypothetical protein